MGCVRPVYNYDHSLIFLEPFMRHRSLLAVGTVVMLAACTVPPIAPPRPRNPAVVDASFGKTWDATLAEFNARNIHIASADRTTGTILADSAEVAANDPTLADCGNMMGEPISPTEATWSAVVQGDSTRSTIKASVKFTRTGMSRDPMSKSTVTEVCSSTGLWETSFEQAVAARAH